MDCKKCGNRTRVIDSRPEKEDKFKQKRTRLCEKCLRVFRSVEVETEEVESQAISICII